MVSEQDQKKLEAEKSVLFYRTNNFFLKDKIRTMTFWNFTVIWIVLAFLLAMSLSISSDNIDRKNLFDFKSLMEGKFINMDLKLVNDLLLMFVPENPQVQFKSSLYKQDFEKFLMKVLERDVAEIGERGV